MCSIVRWIQTLWIHLFRHFWGYLNPLDAGSRQVLQQTLSVLECYTIHSTGMCRMHDPCRSQELLPCLSVVYFFPATLLHQLPFLPLSPNFAIYFLVYLSVLLVPNSYITPFWEFYFVPFSVHVQTNVIYLTLMPLLW